MEVGVFTSTGEEKEAESLCLSRKTLAGSSPLPSAGAGCACCHLQTHLWCTQRGCSWVQDNDLPWKLCPVCLVGLHVLVFRGRKGWTDSIDFTPASGKTKPPAGTFSVGRTQPNTGLHQDLMPAQYCLPSWCPVQGQHPTK